MTAIALAVMVTLDTPVVTEWFVRLGARELEVVTVERLLLLLACAGALVFAFALDGVLTRARLIGWTVPLLAVGVIIAVHSVMARLGDPDGVGTTSMRLAVETALVYSCLGATALIVAISTWRVSQRTRVHRVQLRILTLGGVLLAIVAVANVIAGGILLQRLQVGVWVLRLNRLMLDAAFAGWTLVLMAAWSASMLIAAHEWLRFRDAYEQVTDLFPDLEAVDRTGAGWVETAVARWLDQAAPYGSITASDLEPPPGWRTARWTAAVTRRAQHTPAPLLERVR